MDLKAQQKTNKSHLLLLVFIAFIGIGSNVKAQESDTIIVVDEDPEKILKHIDISKITRNGLTPWKNKFSGHFAGIDFGWNSFGNVDYSGYQLEFMENDVFHSNSAYFNIIQQSFGLQKNKNTVGLVTGLGLQLQSFRLDDNTTFYKNENGIIQPDYVTVAEKQKSKFANVLIVVPLLAEWQLPVNHLDNRIYFSAGVLAGLRINSHTKIKYKNEKKEKIKVVDDFSMPTFTYSLMVRTGYRWFNVFASYDLQPLFKSGKGPEITPFTFGVTLLRF